MFKTLFVSLTAIKGWCSHRVVPGYVWSVKSMSDFSFILGGSEIVSLMGFHNLKTGDFSAYLYVINNPGIWVDADGLFRTKQGHYTNHRLRKPGCLVHLISIMVETYH